MFLVEYVDLWPLVSALCCEEFVLSAVCVFGRVGFFLYIFCMLLYVV